MGLYANDGTDVSRQMKISKWNCKEELSTLSLSSFPCFLQMHLSRPKYCTMDPLLLPTFKTLHKFHLRSYEPLRLAIVSFIVSGDLKLKGLASRDAFYPSLLYFRKALPQRYTSLLCCTHWNCNRAESHVDSSRNNISDNLSKRCYSR